jgi:hypothetical protein
MKLILVLLLALLPACATEQITPDYKDPFTGKACKLIEKKQTSPDSFWASFQCEK